MKSKNKKIKSQKRVIKNEVVIKIDTTPVVPTADQLAEPIKDGKKLTIPKTWISDLQLTRILQRTPREQIYKRPGKGGKVFDYVTGSYVIKVLNYTFGWNWDFEIVEHGKEDNHVWVLGKLTVRGNNPTQTITKTQFGQSEVKKLKAGGNVDYGNDLKSASTDALKKCASSLGFFSDVYGKMEYTEESGNEPVENFGVLEAPKTDNKPELKSGQKIGPDGVPTFVCHKCGEPISDSGAELSMKITGKRLCREHYNESIKK